MTQQQLNREISDATGESLGVISDMGFVPLTTFPVEREPQFIDWDAYEDQREFLIP